jgi:hypothetical protein
MEWLWNTQKTYTAMFLHFGACNSRADTNARELAMHSLGPYLQVKVFNDCSTVPMRHEM